MVKLVDVCIRPNLASGVLGFNDLMSVVGIPQGELEVEKLQVPLQSSAEVFGDVHGPFNVASDHVARHSVEEHHVVEILRLQMGQDDLQDLWEVKRGTAIC